jgi:hypothetical protein
MVQPAFASLVLARPPTDTEFGSGVRLRLDEAAVSRVTLRGGSRSISAAEGPPKAHAIIPEDPIVPDPDDEIIDDPEWEDDEIIRDPDPLEPPIEEPPPGWGALGRA